MKRIRTIGGGTYHTPIRRILAFVLAFVMSGLPLVPAYASAGSDPEASPDMECSDGMKEESPPDRGSVEKEEEDDGKKETEEKSEEAERESEETEEDIGMTEEADVTHVEETGNEDAVSTTGMTDGAALTEEATEEVVTVSAGPDPDLRHENVADDVSDRHELSERDIPERMDEAVSDTESADDDDGTEILNGNHADIGTEAVVSADTGDNEVDDAEGDVSVDTGDATAVAAVVSDVNTTIVGDVVKQVSEMSGTTEGDVDLFSDYLAATEGNDGFLTEGPLPVSVANGNVAKVTNEVSVSADTGDNEVDDAEGDVSVDTGDATAVAAVVNLVNLNLIGSGLFSVVDNFGEFVGDIILPGIGLLSYGSASGPTVVENDNETIVTDTVSAEAATGDNSVSDDSGDADILTGSSLAIADSRTVADVNVVGDRWAYFLFNNFGTWIGEVIDGDGMSVDGNPFMYAVGADTSPVPSEDGSASVVSVSDRNLAVLENRVSASARTGGNAVSDAEGDVSVDTGDATALAGVFNLANVNVIGNDWLFGVFNNFGVWRGNIVFAYPDVAVTIDADRDVVAPGSGASYRISVVNAGLADAEGIRVSGSFPDGFGGIPDVPETLRPGEGFFFDVEGTIDEFPSGTVLSATVSAKTEGVEKHMENNEASDSMTVESVRAEVSEWEFFDSGADADAGGDDDVFVASLELSREDGSGTVVSGGGHVSANITVRNDGDETIRDVAVEDVISDPSGRDIASLFFPVGDLYPGEGAIIEYEILVPTGSDPGSYRTVAVASGDEAESDRSTGGFTVLASVAASSEDSSIGSVPESSGLPIETASAEPRVLGIVEESSRFMPIWMLLFSGVAYHLAINWSLFPKRKRYSV